MQFVPQERGDRQTGSDPANRWVGEIGTLPTRSFDVLQCHLHLTSDQRSPGECHRLANQGPSVS
jgi:hypothetical protein